MTAAKPILTIFMSLTMMALAVCAVVHSIVVVPNILNAIIFSIIFVAIPLFVWLAHRAVVALENLGPRSTTLAREEASIVSSGPTTLPPHDDGTIEVDNPYRAPAS